MTAPDQTPVISNIYWKIFAETNLNDRIQKSWSAATDPDATFHKSNIQDAIQRPVELIHHATEKPKPRIATKPTKASKKRRLDAKSGRGSVSE